MLERPQTGILQKKEIPAILNAMGQGRDSLAMDGITPSFALNFAEGGSIRNQAATATFTRATTATVVDHDSIVRTALSGEARMQGLRRVQNNVVGSENIAVTGTDTHGGTGTLASCTAGFTAPDGTTTAFRIQANIGVGTLNADFSAWQITGTVRVGSVWMKSNTAATQIVLTAFTGAGNVVTATTSWQRVTWSNPGPASAMVFGTLGNLGSTKTIDILVWHPQSENDPGQAVPIPSEYLSTGVLSSPYNGANVDGVKYFPTHNGNVVQQNLALQSQTLDNVNWAAAPNASVTANSTTAPDGTLTADTFVEAATTAAHSLQHNGNIAVTAGQIYTISAYFKDAGRRFVELTTNDSPNEARGFDLVNGTVTAPFSTGAGNSVGRITSVGNGWYRCELVYTHASGATVNPRIYFNNGVANSYAGDGVSGVYVWGYQFQPGRRASTYVPTTTVAVNNNIVEESASDWISPSVRLGYLSEGARTNLILQSEVLGTTWVLVRATQSANATIAPDGNTTADTLIEDATAASTHKVRQNVVKAASALPYSFSIFAKAKERTKFQIGLFNSTESASAVADVNLTAGTVSAVALSTFTSGSASILALANGWFRISITATSDTDTGIQGEMTLEDGTGTTVYNGDNASGMYFWGAQLEQAAFASSYIPTTTVAVTRNTDVLTYPLTGWFNTTFGTMFWQGQRYQSVALNQELWSINDGTTNNRFSFFANGTISVNQTIDVATVNQVNSTTGNSTTANTTFKAAAAYATNDFAVTLNSGTIVGDASGSLPTVTIAQIGAVAAANQLFGTTASIQYYPRRLTNTQLQNMTR